MMPSMAALNRFADILGALRIVSLCTATMSRSGPTFAAKIASVRTRPARGQYLVFSGDAELSVSESTVQIWVISGHFAISDRLRS
jgi:hypothetical protein